jgi:hypothetical protein
VLGSYESYLFATTRTVLLVTVAMKPVRSLAGSFSIFGRAFTNIFCHFVAREVSGGEHESSNPRVQERFVFMLSVANAIVLR